MKRLTLLLAMLTATAISINAEELESQESNQKTTIEVPAWVKNIKFSGYGMLQYLGNLPYNW